MIIRETSGQGTLELRVKRKLWVRAYHRGQRWQRQGRPIPAALADVSPKASALMQGWTTLPVITDDIHASMRATA